MKKSIAIISEHASPLKILGGADSGGQNLYVAQTAKHLANLGYEVDIFTRRDNPKIPYIVEYQKNVRVIHIKAGPATFIKKEFLSPYMDEFTKGVLQLIEEENKMYDIVHAHFFMSGQVAADIKKTLGIPFVITFHALGKIRRLFQGKKDEFSDKRFETEERIVQEADQIIAECPQDREDLIYYYGANTDKITIIPAGFDPEEFYPIEKETAKRYLGLDLSKRYILQLGRMVERKGVDTVISALPELSKKFEKAHLLIVGGESYDPNPQLTPEIGRLQRLAKDLGLEQHITFVGRRARRDLKYYYNASDIFVSTPWYEPFGMTPLEAMACGTPVIGSKVGGIKFSIIDGVTGLLVTPQNPPELASKMIEILENEKRARIFGDNAVKRVNTFFTWENIASMLSSLYEKILSTQYANIRRYQEQSDIVEQNFDELEEVIRSSKAKLRLSVINVSRIIVKSLLNDGRILICGNGGSAAQSQHFAAELVGHYFKDDRLPFDVMALTGDSVILTALSNDFSYKDVFSRQVKAYGRPGDVLIAISTSGMSENILEALDTARKKDMVCIGMTGKTGGKMLDYCDISLIVPSDKTSCIQDIHSTLIHTISELVERELYQKTSKEEKVFQQIAGLKGGKSLRKGGNGNE